MLTLALYEEVFLFSRSYTLSQYDIANHGRTGNNTKLQQYTPRIIDKTAPTRSYL